MLCNNKVQGEFFKAGEKRLELINQIICSNNLDDIIEQLFVSETSNEIKNVLDYLFVEDVPLMAVTKFKGARNTGITKEEFKEEYIDANGDNFVSFMIMLGLM